MTERDDLLERLQAVKKACSTHTWKSIAEDTGVPFNWLMKRTMKGFLCANRMKRHMNYKAVIKLEEWVRQMEISLGTHTSKVSLEGLFDKKPISDALPPPTL